MRSFGGRSSQFQRVKRVKPPRAPAATFPPAPPAPAVYTESFNKADGPLGPDLPWFQDSGAGGSIPDLSVLSNRLTTNSSGPAWAVAQSPMTTQDQYAQIEWVAASPVATNTLRLYLRCDSIANDYLLASINHNGGGNINIGYGPSANTTYDDDAAGHTWRFEITGTTATILRDGVTMLSTDITGLGGDGASDVYAGIEASGSFVGDYLLDNFEYGDL